MQSSNVQVPVIYLFISLFLYCFCHQLPRQVALKANDSEMERKQEWKKTAIQRFPFVGNANDVVLIMY